MSSIGQAWRAAPVLRRVLMAGIRELERDPDIEAYTTALAAGDHDAIVMPELAALRSDQPPSKGSEE